MTCQCCLPLDYSINLILTKYSVQVNKNVAWYIPIRSSRVKCVCFLIFLLDHGDLPRYTSVTCTIQKVRRRLPTNINYQMIALLALTLITTRMKISINIIGVFVFFSFFFHFFFACDSSR